MGSLTQRSGQELKNVRKFKVAFYITLPTSPAFRRLPRPPMDLLFLFWYLLIHPRFSLTACVTQLAFCPLPLKPEMAEIENSE